ncbi:hypothetical protein D3C87_1141800 [compost metagenome]
MHVVEGAVAGRIVSDRTREQLVPTGELREFSLDVHRVLGTEAQVSAVIGQGHQFGATLVQKQRDLLGFEQARQFMMQCCQLFAQLPFAAFGGLLHMKAAFLQFQADRHRGGVFLFQFITKTGELVDPGFDAKHMTALVHHAKPALPTVVAQVVHGFALPDLITLGPPANAHGQFVVPIGKHLAGDHHLLAHHGLDGELPAIEGRHGVFDHDARQQ